MENPSREPSVDQFDWKYDARATVKDPNGEEFVVRVVPRGHLHRDWAFLIFGVLVWVVSALVHRFRFHDEFVVVVLRPRGWRNQHVLRAEVISGKKAAIARAREVTAQIAAGNWSDRDTPR